MDWAWSNWNARKSEIGGLDARHEPTMHSEQGRWQRGHKPYIDTYTPSMYRHDEEVIILVGNTFISLGIVVFTAFGSCTLYRLKGASHEQTTQFVDNPDELNMKDTECAKLWIGSAGTLISPEHEQVLLNRCQPLTQG